jgi:hypothetical protein
MQPSDQTGPSNKPHMKRVLLSLPADLLAAIDHEAKYNYMTRSDLMRRALIWYLRPAAQARRQAGFTEDEQPEELYTNPEELLKILQQQKLRAGIQAMLRDAKRQRTEQRQRRQ